MTEPTPFLPKPVHTVIDAQLEAAQRRAVIAAALSWCGTPYRQCGYTKGPRGAVDCSMLLVGAIVEGRVYEAFDPRPYSPVWFMARSEEKYLAWLNTVAVEVDTPKPGDIIAYRVGRCFAHSGIMADDTFLVHAYAKTKKCTRTELTTPDLAKRPKKYFDIWQRIRSLSNG